MSTTTAAVQQETRRERAAVLPLRYEKVTIMLLRHAHGLSNVETADPCRHRDPGLSELGKAQVKSLVYAVDKMDPDLVFTSPLQRAMETAAQLFSTFMNLRTDDFVPVVACSELREICGGAEFLAEQVRPGSELAKKFPEVDCSGLPDSSEPCGKEGRVDLKARIVSFIEKRLFPLIVSSPTGNAVGCCNNNNKGESENDEEGQQQQQPHDDDDDMAMNREKELRIVLVSHFYAIEEFVRSFPTCINPACAENRLRGGGEEEEEASPSRTTVGQAEEAKLKNGEMLTLSVFKKEGGSIRMTRGVGN